VIALLLVLAVGTVVWLVLGAVDSLQARRPPARITQPPRPTPPAPSWDTDPRTGPRPTRAALPRRPERPA
jgi:hypothetical protein